MILSSPLKRHKKFKYISIFLLMVILSFQFVNDAHSFGRKYTCGTDSAGRDCKCEVTCEPKIKNCAEASCACQSTNDTELDVPHITDHFVEHRTWIIKSVWEAHILPSMMLMTEQISTMAVQQMLMVGTLFDAKHQLETQRLLQEMQAQAHKDYQPSKGMCEFGTSTRSLAASDRNADFTAIAIAERALQRNLLSGDGIGAGGNRDDSRSRMAQFKDTYCDPADFGNGMGAVCNLTTNERINRDIDFTLSMALENTLDLDFSDASTSPDEEDIMALAINLYGHNLLPRIATTKLATSDGKTIPKGAYAYMMARSLHAQRSVAQAAFAAQAAMKSAGTESVQPYMLAILKDMGIEEQNIRDMIGERPSYDSQMKVLTKTLYQTPNFYTELYDKPTNIDRKIVSMQAIGLMQRRDMYRSTLRREAIEAVWLENALAEYESELNNNIRQTNSRNPIIEIEALQ